MNLLVSVLIAISLSMDAFSLALSIGVLSFPKKWRIVMALCVGVFHFFMPLLGSLLGTSFINHFHVDIHFLSGIIFAYIALQMFKEFFDKSEENFQMNFLGVIIFAFGVSLDSFGVGFTMTGGFNVMAKTTFIFAVFSALFTYSGLSLGKILYNVVGRYSILLGGLIMIILSVINFCQFFLF